MEDRHKVVTRHERPAMCGDIDESCVLALLPENYRKRPANTGVNTDGSTGSSARNFVARRREIPVAEMLISWLRHEISIQDFIRAHFATKRCRRRRRPRDRLLDDEADQRAVALRSCVWSSWHVVTKSSESCHHSGARIRPRNSGVVCRSVFAPVFPGRSWL